MLYNNYSQEAISELERQRTGNYGYDREEYPEYECSECRVQSGMFFKINSKVYCSECICDYLREEFYKISENKDDGILPADEILKDIISDFSDNELLCYVENKYERLN